MFITLYPPFRSLQNYYIAPPGICQCIITVIIFSCHCPFSFNERNTSFVK
nr:MAG TPA: hypothetical protein [Caudoviricetes sp.]